MCSFCLLASMELIVKSDIQLLYMHPNNMNSLKKSILGTQSYSLYIHVRSCCLDNRITTYLFIFLSHMSHKNNKQTNFENSCIFYLMPSTADKSLALSILQANL